jgi:hypothetical protein
MAYHLSHAQKHHLNLRNVIGNALSVCESIPERYELLQCYLMCCIHGLEHANLVSHATELHEAHVSSANAEQIRVALVSAEGAVGLSLRHLHDAGRVQEDPLG